MLLGHSRPFCPSFNFKVDVSAGYRRAGRHLKEVQCSGKMNLSRPSGFSLGPVVATVEQLKLDLFVASLHSSVSPATVLQVNGTSSCILLGL